MQHINEATRRLGIEHPIIQGPFGGGLSTVKLAATVSNAGGLGSYGAHGLLPAQIKDVVGELRAATARPFALNLWVSDHDGPSRRMSREQYEAGLRWFGPLYEELGVKVPTFPEEPALRFEDQVAAVLEARPPVFSFVFGIPSPEILAECRRRGIITVGAATTVAEALAIEAAGVDLVLATGCEAGGHRPSFLKSAEESLVGTFALVPQVVDAVKIPVVAAGGIADARGVRAARALGAQAVQVGTAFLACAESGTSDLHLTYLRGDTARDTTLSRGFSGRLARFIRNRYTSEFAARGEAPLPYPFQNWFSGFLKHGAGQRAEPELMALYAGQGAPLIRHRGAAELMEELSRGARG